VTTNTSFVEKDGRTDELSFSMERLKTEIIWSMRAMLSLVILAIAGIPVKTNLAYFLITTRWKRKHNLHISYWIYVKLFSTKIFLSKRRSINTWFKTRCIRKHILVELVQCGFCLQNIALGLLLAWYFFRLDLQSTSLLQVVQCMRSTYLRDVTQEIIACSLTRMLRLVVVCFLLFQCKI